MDGLKRRLERLEQRVTPQEPMATEQEIESYIESLFEQGILFWDGGVVKVARYWLGRADFRRIAELLNLAVLRGEISEP